MSRNIDRGIALIKEFEGLYLKAYLCPAGIPTIGWGTTEYPDGRKVKIGETISEQDAERFLRHHVQVYVNALNNALKIPVNDNQYSALLSWTYNIGAGAMRSSTLIRVLNQGNYAQAADELLRWDKATVNGVKRVLSGLARRRRSERELFLEPIESARPSEEALDVATPSWFEPFKEMIRRLFDAIFGKKTPPADPFKHPEFKFAFDFLVADGVNERIATRFINFWAEQTRANFSYFFNYDKRCNENRFYVFSRRDKTISQYRSTHGVGSDPNNTGVAQRFSNVSGSKQSTLGLVRTGETYTGRNGRSLRLDGLDSTNSNMRQRLIVIHGANYAESCGRSEGCPTIHHNMAQAVIGQLMNGSPGFHYHKSMV
jgi:GH24 family phage-related lysozyme (muramidase)